MTQELKSNKFTLKDSLSIAISITALTISGIAFYYSNLRIDNSLEAKVIKIYIQPAVNDSIDIDTCIIQVAYLNVGNRQASVINTLFSFESSETYPHQVVADSTAYGNLFSNDDLFPFIIAAHDIKIIELKLLFKKNGETYLRNYYGKNDNDLYDRRVFFKEASLKLEFLALDSKGTFYSTITKDYRGHIYYDDKLKKWHCLISQPPRLMKTQKEMDNWEFESTSLFK